MGGSNRVSDNSSLVASFIYFNDVWRSEDEGLTWIALNNAGWSNRTGFGLVANGDSMYVYGGKGLYWNIPFFVTCLNDVWVTNNGGLQWIQLQSGAR